MWPSPRWASASTETFSGSKVTLTSLMVSTPSGSKRSSPLLVPLFVLIDSNCLNDLFRFRPGEVDRQQPVFQIRAQHMHPLRQHDTQPFGLPIAAVAALDVVGRIAVGAFDDAIERTLDFVEPKQERTG